MKCRLCGASDYDVIFQADNCPRFSHKYLTEAQLASDSPVKLTVLKCRRCDLIQLQDKFPEDEYSSDYQRNISFSKSAVDYANETADRLAGYSIKNLVEIGCGNGLFASTMMARGVHVTAFEPSRAACETARQKGIDANNLFFDARLPKRFSGYDGFALRFVLEHIDDPLGLIRILHDRCSDGATGLVEVPNAQQQLNQGKWFEFFREHVLYFTPATLVAMLQKGGFELLGLDSTLKGEFIRAIVRKAAPPAAWHEKDVKARLRSLIEPGKTTWAWSASGGGVTIIAEAGLTSAQLQFIIDSDSNKWDLYTSGSRIKIVAPENLRKSPPDNIIILSPAYEREILKTIRGMGFKGKVGSLLPAPRWLED